MTTNSPFGEPPAGQPKQPPQAPGVGAPPPPPPAFGPPANTPAPGYGQPPTYGQPSYSQPASSGAPAYDPTSRQSLAGGSSAWTPGGVDQLDSGSSSPSGSKRAFIPWIIGLVVILVLGGGAVAVRAALSTDTGGPAAALPSSSLMFARLDVDPSAGQKIQALRLAQKFPGFADATGITDTDADLRSSLFDALKGESPELADIDYAADVEPWLGTSVGFALLPAAPDSTTPGFALAIEVTDQGEAADGITKLLAAAGTDEPAGVAFTGSYAIIAETQALADGYVADAEDASLADNEEFQHDMTSLGDEGVASAWVSADAYTELSDLATELGGMVPGAGGAAGLGVGAAPAVPFQSGSAAYALRFGDRYAEIAMVGSGSESPVEATDSESPIGGLPETTLAAMSIANGGQYVQASLDQLQAVAEQTGEDFERQINRFERQTGLTIPDDFVTLLGDNFTMAVDSELGDLASPTDLRVGALLDTDPAAAQTIIDKLVTLAGGGLELQTVETDGMLAVSPNAAYAAELTGGSLGDSSAFNLAMPYGTDADMAFYVNFDALTSIDEFSSLMSAEDLANLATLQAVGASVQLTGDGEARGSIRVTVDE